MNQNKQGQDKAKQRSKMGQDRDRMEDNKRGQQQGEEQANQQQGGWNSDMENQKGNMGRKPGAERDRDYDPDGERINRP